MGLNSLVTVSSPNGLVEDPSCCSNGSIISGQKWNDLNGDGVLNFFDVSAFLGAVAAAGLTVTDLTTEEPDLEDVFLELTRAQP